MAIIRQLTPDLIYTGVNDRRIALFENVYPVSAGVSYNSYVLRDRDTVIFDTADGGFTDKYLQNVEAALAGTAPSYLVVHHMEPDHSASIKALADKYPSMKIILNAKTKAILANYFAGLDDRTVCVKDGEELNIGKHTLKFVFAPMVHWPEVMFTYDVTDKVLFSADAFGSFGAIDGSIFSDEADFEAYLPEARRYYTNIVGKYGPQVMNLLKKAGTIDIKTICPLHGPVWRKDLDYIIDKHVKWATYEPEEKGVLIAYASFYGNTENAAQILATKLCERGITNIKMYDVSNTHVSYLISDAFKYSHMALLSATYNNDLFPPMEEFIRDMQRLNLQNRSIAIAENGTWAPQACKVMCKMIGEMKKMTLLNEKLSMLSQLGLYIIDQSMRHNRRSL